METQGTAAANVLEFIRGVSQLISRSQRVKIALARAGGCSASFAVAALILLSQKKSA
jgi:hypothetical protein